MWLAEDKYYYWTQRIHGTLNYSLEEELANYGPKAKSGPPPVSLSEVLPEQNHAHLFKYYPGLFWCYNDSTGRHYMTCKTYNIY